LLLATWDAPLRARMSYLNRKLLQDTWKVLKPPVLKRKTRKQSRRIKGTVKQSISQGTNQQLLSQEAAVILFNVKVRYKNYVLTEYIWLIQMGLKSNI
jgi:hypothetical protein